MATDDNVVQEDMTTFNEQNLVHSGWEPDDKDGIVEVERVVTHTDASGQQGVCKEATVFNSGEYVPLLEYDKYNHLSQEDWDVEPVLKLFAWWRGDFGFAHYEIYKRTSLMAANKYFFGKILAFFNSARRVQQARPIDWEKK